MHAPLTSRGRARRSPHSTRCPAPPAALAAAAAAAAPPQLQMWRCAARWARQMRPAPAGGPSLLRLPQRPRPSRMLPEPGAAAAGQRRPRPSKGASGAPSSRSPVGQQGRGCVRLSATTPRPLPGWPASNRRGTPSCPAAAPHGTHLLLHQPCTAGFTHTPCPSHPPAFMPAPQPHLAALHRHVKGRPRRGIQGHGRCAALQRPASRTQAQPAERRRRQLHCPARAAVARVGGARGHAGQLGALGSAQGAVQQAGNHPLRVGGRWQRVWAGGGSDERRAGRGPARGTAVGLLPAWLLAARVAVGQPRSGACMPMHTPLSIPNPRPPPPTSRQPPLHPTLTPTNQHTHAPTCTASTHSRCSSSFSACSVYSFSGDTCV